MDTAINPDSWTGDMPLNALVTLECQNRPDQLPFIVRQMRQNKVMMMIRLSCLVNAQWHLSGNQTRDGMQKKDFSNASILRHPSKDPLVGWTLGWQGTSL